MLAENFFHNSTPLAQLTDSLATERYPSRFLPHPAFHGQESAL